MWPAWLLVLLSLAVILLLWSMVLMLMMLLSMVAVVPLAVLAVAPRPQVLTSLVRRFQIPTIFRGAVHSPAGHPHHPPRWFLGRGAGHLSAVLGCDDGKADCMMVSKVCRTQWRAGSPTPGGL